MLYGISIESIVKRVSEFNFKLKSIRTSALTLYKIMWKRAIQNGEKHLRFTAFDRTLAFW